MDSGLDPLVSYIIFWCLDNKNLFLGDEVSLSCATWLGPRTKVRAREIKEQASDMTYNCGMKTLQLTPRALETWIWLSLQVWHWNVVAFWNVTDVARNVSSVAECDVSVSKLLGFETFLFFGWFQIQYRKSLVSGWPPSDSLGAPFCVKSWIIRWKSDSWILKWDKWISAFFYFCISFLSE